MTTIQRKTVDYWHMSDDRRNHATITIDTDTGHVVINCDDRRISGSYTWMNCQTGCDGIYEFLAKNGHDWHYFMMKFVPDLFKVFSFEKSKRELKLIILSKRRNREISRAEALDAWFRTDQCENEFDLYEMSDFIEPMMFSINEMSEDVQWFADTFWLPFIKHIRSLHKEFSQAT